MLNLEKIAINAVTNALNSDELKQTIESRIEKTITSVLHESFHEYSDFGRDFKEAVKNEMKLDLESVGFLEYNHFVAATIKDRFKAQTESATFNQVDEMLKSIIGSAAPVVTIDSLVDDMKKQKEDHDDSHCGQFALIFSRGANSWDNGKIKISFDDDREMYDGRDNRAGDCRSSITVSMETKKVIGFDMGHQGNTEKAKITTYNHNFESKLFRMYATGTVIDFGDHDESIMEMTPGDELSADEFDIDTSYDWHEDY